MASLRLLIPRAGFPLHSRQLQHRLLIPAVRYASAAPPKPRVLEKPERFNPPSHPSRLRKPRQYPGPPLSEHERQAQKTKRYPHMMPPEGTFLHWFITSRAIHTWITLSILVGLVLFIWVGDFLHNTPYIDLLPPNSMFLEHPFAFLARYWEIYAMHVAHVSEQTAERRRQHVEDVRKKAEYRKAHGIGQGEGILGGWTVKSDAETLGPGIRESGTMEPRPGPDTTMELAKATVENVEGKRQEETYVDFDGTKRIAKKKWFGIW